MTREDGRKICIVVAIVATLLALVYLVGYRTEPKIWWVVPLTLVGALCIGGFFGCEHASFRRGLSNSSRLDIIAAPSIAVIFGSLVAHSLFDLPFGPILTAVMLFGVAIAFWAFDELPPDEHN